MGFAPTITILGLLLFFVALSAGVFFWYWRRHRALQRKRFLNPSRESVAAKAPRKLTLRDGKAIPHALVLDTSSEKDRYSLELQSPGLELEKQFEYDIEKGFTRTSVSRKSSRSRRISRNSVKSTFTDRGPSWTPPLPPWLRKTPPQSIAPTEATDSRLQSFTRSHKRDRSVSVPRPALINIERRDSGQTAGSSRLSSRSRGKPVVGRRTSSKTQATQGKPEKRKGVDITESLLNAYKGGTPWTGEVHNLPTSSVVLPGPAKSVAGSTRNSGQRWSIPATASVHSSAPTNTSFNDSSRVTSIISTLQHTAPVAGSAGGVTSQSSDVKPSTPSRVSFAPTPELNRKSFLTITESPTSSTSSEAAVLGRKSIVSTPLATPLTAPPVPTLPAWASEYNEQARPMKTFSAPAQQPPEVLEKVRAFGRRHRDRPRSGSRRKKLPQVTVSEERPISLSQRRQISSELLRSLERPRSKVRHERGTSDLLHQLEESANQVQRQSRTPSSALPGDLVPPSPAPATAAGHAAMGDSLTPDSARLSPNTVSMGISQELLISPSDLTQDNEQKATTVRQRRMHLAGVGSPNIEIDIPRTTHGSFSFLDSIPSPPRSGTGLRRGPSVMSNRSGFTIASSEISANWSIGKAELVNIYPSVADDEDEYESIRKSMRESLRQSVGPRDKSPPYAKLLRSKYRQHPKSPKRSGTKDKALPGLPRSPLRQSTFAPKE